MQSVREMYVWKPMKKRTQYVQEIQLISDEVSYNWQANLSIFNQK
jgi:hypothetical protein